MASKVSVCLEVEMGMDFTHEDLQNLTDEIKFLSPRYQELVTALIATAFRLAELNPEVDELTPKQGAAPEPRGNPAQAGPVGIVGPDLEQLPSVQDLFEGSHKPGERIVEAKLRTAKVGGRIGQIFVRYDNNLR